MIRFQHRAEGDDRSVGSLFAAHVDLARGRLLLGGPDGTGAVRGLFLTCPPERMSVGVVCRLAALGPELNGWQYGEAVRAACLRVRLQHVAVVAAPPAAHPRELAM
ncbi:hypothetical protein [Streptomyces sp. SAS_270]|uniref:hypothetical protein n=1 Tax=Streptomyces sp. SAS_270 TaxID=3412748 RepID=UPI00403C575E